MAPSRILKKAQPWQNDKSLHKLLGEKVLVKGCPTALGIDYVEVGPLERLAAPRAETVKKLKLGFSIIPDPIWLNHMPKGARGRGKPASSCFR